MVVEKTWTTVNVARKWVFQGRLCRVVQQAMWSLWLPSILWSMYSLISWETIRFFFLEPTRSFTFVHMLICQLCYKQLCWLHEKSTRAIIYHAICEIFYINKIPKFCIAGGWCCHKKCVFQLLSSFFNPCPHLTILILWWPRRLWRIFFIQNNINNHCILHAIHPHLRRPSPGNVRYFAWEIHFNQK